MSLSVPSGEYPFPLPKASPIPPEHCAAVAKWACWRDDVQDSSNDDLARLMVALAQSHTWTSDVLEIAAERLSPGIVDRMSDEFDAKQQAEADAGGCAP